MGSQCLHAGANQAGKESRHDPALAQPPAYRSLPCRHCRDGRAGHRLPQPGRGGDRLQPRQHGSGRVAVLSSRRAVVARSRVARAVPLAPAAHDPGRHLRVVSAAWPGRPRASARGAFAGAVSRIVVSVHIAFDGPVLDRFYLNRARQRTGGRVRCVRFQSARACDHACAGGPC